MARIKQARPITLRQVEGNSLLDLKTVCHPRCRLRKGVQMAIYAAEVNEHQKEKNVWTLMVAPDIDDFGKMPEEGFALDPSFSLVDFGRQIKVTLDCLSVPKQTLDYALGRWGRLEIAPNELSLGQTLGPREIIRNVELTFVFGGFAASVIINPEIAAQFLDLKQPK